MAAVSITAANVKQQGRCTVVEGLFGATMTAGQCCYLDGSAGSWKLLDADLNLDDGTQFGIVLVGAASAGYGRIVVAGPMDIGGTLTASLPYIAGETAGAIHPVADFTGFTTAWQYHLGYATATGTLIVKPFKTGASVA